MITSTNRIACQVLFCKRTGSAEKFAGEEIICGKCWKNISKATKRERANLRRRHKKIDRLLMRYAILSKHGRADQLYRLNETFKRRNAANWEKCKKEANEVAAGIRG